MEYQEMSKIFVLLLVVFVAACSGGDESSNAAPVQQKEVNKQQVGQSKKPMFTSISSVQANELIKSRKNILILDVRSPPELKEGKIKGSQLVPFWDIAKGRYIVPRGVPVLLVCAVGGRSYAVGQYLYQQKYSEVYNLKSGMSGWKKAGLPVVY
jgi:phage shock protein E